MLQGCSCLSSVATYLLALCCSGAAVLVVSKPICQDCVAEVQLFKRCRNLAACILLQGCSCLSGVATYLLGTVLQGCSLLKQCHNPICRHCAAGVQLFKCCLKLISSTVMQVCSCFSGVETYLPGLCCSGAAA